MTKIVYGQCVVPWMGSQDKNNMCFCHIQRLCNNTLLKINVVYCSTGGVHDKMHPHRIIHWPYYGQCVVPSIGRKTETTYCFCFVLGP